MRAAWLSLLLACSPAPSPQIASPSLAVSTSASASARVAEPAPPLVPPYYMLRLVHPGRVLDALSKVSTGAYNIDLVATLFTGERAGSLIDIDTPVDVIIVADKKYVGRVRLRDGASALLRERFGATSVDGALRFATSERVCVARDGFLVCATDEPTLRIGFAHLGDVDGAPPADAHARLVLGQGVPEPPKSTSREDLQAYAVGTLIGSVSELVLDATASGALEASGTIAFGKDGSALSRALTGPTSAAVLAAYRRLPADARFSLMTIGAPAADMVPFNRMLHDEIAKSTVDDGYPPAYATELGDLVSTLFLTGGPLVAALGYDDAEIARAATKYRAKHSDKTRADLRAALAGYAIVGFEENASKWSDGLRKLTEVDNRGVKKTGAGVAKDKDKEDANAESTKERIVATPPGFPLHTLHIETTHTLRKPPVPAPPAYVSHALVVPDGNRTWVVLASDIALARAKVAALLDGSAASLGQRSDARCSARATLCMAVSIAEVAQFENARTPVELDAALAREELLRSAPTTPATIEITESGGRAAYHAIVPADVAAAVAALLPN